MIFRIGKQKLYVTYSPSLITFYIELIFSITEIDYLYLILQPGRITDEITLEKKYIQHVFDKTLIKRSVYKAYCTVL